MPGITRNIISKIIGLTLFLHLSFLTSAHASDLITKSSPHSVDKTISQFETALKDAGATLFAKIDHAAGAKKIGSTLRPTTVIIFGNPKIGTPAMIIAQTIGLDLPLRVVIFEDKEGKTQIAYHPPKTLSANHNIEESSKVLEKMTSALNKLTDAAIK